MYSSKKQNVRNNYSYYFIFWLIFKIDFYLEIYFLCDNWYYDFVVEK